ncbi:MAG TPA: ATP-binding protein [Planctomycetota bacterium]|nr:ATP-binding protein [Planctomycetota bacterium]
MSSEPTTALPAGSRPCACVLNGDPPKFVVVTGGPGAGKTAALEMARRSFCRHVAVLGEAAGILFGGGFPRTPDDAGRRAAQRAIFFVQREYEDLARSRTDLAVALCDRGLIDGEAYWPGPPSEFWSEVGMTPDAAASRYAAVVHLRVPGVDGGFNRVNPLRIESADQAAALDARIAEAWRRHPRRTVVPSHDSFLVKARTVLEAVRAELPECCRDHELDLGS